MSFIKIYETRVGQNSRGGEITKHVAAENDKSLSNSPPQVPTPQVLTDWAFKLPTTLKTKFLKIYTCF